eukprot:TRINITY_DN5331_c1_g2_i2.p1 TRINITY_DN5331_c1_g2~~TRINITY_DN5331_c1_g2_i2.p1  ORF type:complete len:500 (+),score=63.50 TRINITY_DN5331_c1_g2_i2:309-1808(+)
MSLHATTPLPRFTPPVPAPSPPAANRLVKSIVPRYTCKEFVVIQDTEENGVNGDGVSPSPSPVPRGGGSPVELLRLPRVKRYSIDTINANLRNEDRSIIDVTYDDVHLFAVLDGHGGPTCSIFCEKTVSSIFRSNRRASPTPICYKSVLRKTLQDLDGAYIKEHAYQYKSCGSCAIVCLVTHDEVITGCVGDCRAIIARRNFHDNKIVPIVLSQDQDCSNKSECDIVKQRTTDPTPIRLCQNGTRRVAGTLMVTRALGDVYLKMQEFSFPPYRLHVPYITSDPVITVHPLSDGDLSLVMASDGLYNLLDNQKVAELALREAKAGGLVDAAVDRAAEVVGMTTRMVRQIPPGRERRQVHDDITVLIVDFGDNMVRDSSLEPVISEPSMREREALSPIPQEGSFGDREASVILLEDPPPPPSPLLPSDDDVNSTTSSQQSAQMSLKTAASGYSSFLRRMKKRSAKPSPPPRRSDSAPGTPALPSPASTPGSQQTPALKRYV